MRVMTQAEIASDLFDECAKQRARIAELEAALAPFARMADLNLRDDDPPQGAVPIVMSAREMRAARAAMKNAR